ncbi:hypothetical protein BG005_005277 [Podila minutissima]|nr:hypothetical protein BG005_005277 [Podila minutissima]
MSTSSIHSGAAGCQICLSKNQQILAKDEVIRAKDAVIAAKDDAIAQKDLALKAERELREQLQKQLKIASAGVAKKSSIANLKSASSQAQEEKDALTIYIRNVTENVSYDMLHEAFSAFGTIRTLNVVHPKEREKTTGKGWFDLPQQVMTPELKRDLQILKLRNVLDPKRFYKREEKGKPKFPKYFQVGTIIEGNTEFYSSRLTKKERATTITGEVMKDEVGRDYYKRKFDEIQVSKQSGGKRFNKKGKGKQSKSWRAGK